VDAEARKKLTPRVQAALDEIERRRAAREERKDEAEAGRWLLAIEVREQRKRAAEQQAVWDAEDRDPALQSIRRIWEEIVHPKPYGKTPEQLARKEERRRIREENKLNPDPMTWKL